MKTARLALVVVLVAVFSFIVGRRSAPTAAPSVKFPAPKISVETRAGDQVCTRITHRYNPTTGRLEPVAQNDPLGIR